MIDIPRPAAAALVHLFQGPVERDRMPETWRDLVAHQQYVRPYCAVLGLDVHIDDADGFAFLRQRTEPGAEESVGGEKAGQPPLPRLIARHNLSLRLSVLLVLLRKRLLELDAAGSETRLVIARDKLIEDLRLFWPAGANEVKIVEQIEAVLKQATELNLLRKLAVDPPAYEVRRLVKALVDAQWLADLDAKLAEYRAFSARGGEDAAS
jgi:hypothetical protein